MIVFIDNYDSFTYNLVQYLGDLGAEISLHRNDQISVEAALELNPKGFMISPGPGDPAQAGICMDLVRAAAKNDIPLLGVCLGHQAIGQVFGGKIIQTAPMHGKVSNITHNSSGIFKSLPCPLDVTRYHSLIIERQSCPEELEITAQSDDGLIMGVQHKTKPIHGVQFHPESIATQHGYDIIRNFTEIL